MTEGLVNTVERIDDIPLLLAQMDKIQLVEILDKHFPMHGNWQGLGLGHVTQVWLAYILSEGDHRLNHVESWTDGLLITLGKCLGIPVRSLDFSDDRLAVILDCFGQDDKFAEFEGDLNQGIIRVYDLRPKRVRIEVICNETKLQHASYQYVLLQLLAYQFPLVLAYSATKGAIKSFTRSLFIEYCLQGLHANCVMPSNIESPLSRSFCVPEGADPKLLKSLTPLDSYVLVHPEYVAGTIAFLASDDAYFINGTEVSVDGGKI